MDEALTAQEYLDACDLGIQNRSLPYIRTRFAMTTASRIRADKKCGNSNIPDNRQCRNGGGIGRKLATGAAIAGGVAAAAYGAHKLSQGRSFGSSLNSAVRQRALPGTADPNYKRPGSSPFGGMSSAAGRTARAASVMGRRRASQAGRAASSAFSNAQSQVAYQTSRRTAFGRGMRRAGREATNAARQVGSMFGRRDSIWAAGFEPYNY